MKRVVEKIDPQNVVELGKVSKEKIYGVVGQSGTVYKAHSVGESKWAFIALDDTYYYMADTFDSLEGLLRDVSEPVYEFDKVIEFLKWALAQANPKAVSGDII